MNKKKIALIIAAGILTFTLIMVMAHFGVETIALND